MKSNKIILRIAFVLLILNLVVLGLILFPKKDHFPKDDRPKNIIIERLGFQAEQISAYEKLIEEHRKSIFEQESKIRKLKKELYNLLSEDNSRLEAEKITQQIGNAQSQIEFLHFNHFKDIRNLCTDEQIPKFDELSEDLARIFGRRRPKKDKP